MSANTNASKVQTAFRLDAWLIDRVKKAAKLLNISVNEFVSTQLKEATKDIRSDKEMAEERKKTKAFLAECGGSWKGTETVEEIMHSIKEGNVEKDIINL